MSPYFPDQREVAPYWCPNCRAWYVPSNTSCLMNHPAGGCCHKYEQKLGTALRPRKEGT